jgi:hypothetical protein
MNGQNNHVSPIHFPRAGHIHIYSRQLFVRAERKLPFKIPPAHCVIIKLAIFAPQNKK